MSIMEQKAQEQIEGGIVEKERIDLQRIKLADSEIAEREAYEMAELEHYVARYRTALIEIVKTAPENGEDCSFLIAKNALSFGMKVIAQQEDE